jgi:pilus assembly protein CpaE
MAAAKPPEKTGILLYAASPEAVRRLSTAVLSSGRYTPVDFDSHLDGGKPHDRPPVHAGLVDIGDGGLLDTPVMDRLLAALQGAPLVVVSTPLSPERTRQLLRLGVADWLLQPCSDAEIVASLGQTSGNAKSAFVASFVPASGGAGATTMTLLAAGILGRKSRTDRTAVVDLDFQSATCAAYLNAVNDFDIESLVANPDRLDGELVGRMQRARDPGIALYSFERPELYFSPLGAQFVLRLLDLTAAASSAVLVDLPNLRTPWFTDVVRHSDKVFIVCELNVPSLGRARRLLADIAAARGSNAGIEAIINKAEFKLFGNVIARGDVEKMLSGIPFRTVASDTETLGDAVNRGLLASEVAPRSRLVREAAAMFDTAFAHGGAANRSR